ncbi:hypothetical protein KSF78_0000597 [Schistosoma japonicum]|nr:hypothetical protein KSF78_0000597 [Schistosoma japonicum]
MITIDPVYFCPFTKNLCDWTNDPNSWQNQWSVVDESTWDTDSNDESEQSYCCLTAATYSGPGSSSTAVSHSPWIIKPYLITDLQDSTTNKPIHSRL